VLITPDMTMARPEIIGCKPFDDGFLDNASARQRMSRAYPLDAYTIPEFCHAHRISRAHYYVLRRRGLGPDEAALLGRKIITKEAAARWRRRHTRRARLQACDV